MKVKTILYLITSTLFLTSFIQTANKTKIVTWEDLSYVGYRATYSPVNNTRYEKPLFAKNILKLHNNEIQISGYVIPMDANHERFFLSAQPNSSCYFCGASAKHTIMDLRMKNLPQNYKMDEYLTFKGILKTHTEMENLPYSLENAILVKE